ncbi:MAG: hypothetical protein NTW79_04165 [Candidatus Berkelbacteria bacterium]|nr:hypothetical protein [Candidatus Berkelbacteria bacterium]
MDNEEKTIEKNFSDESKTTKILLGVLLVVLVAVVLISVLLWKNVRRDQSANIAGTSESGSVLGASTEDPDYLSSLTDDLKAKGFVLYGSSQSSETTRQKNIFGQAFSNLDYVECDPNTSGANPDECSARGISVFPTWISGDQAFPGFQSVEQLQELADQKDK